MFDVLNRQQIGSRFGSWKPTRSSPLRSSMPFFVGDYLGSIIVPLMTLAVPGAYVHPLCLNWQDGRLQKRPGKICEINGRW